MSDPILQTWDDLLRIEVDKQYWAHLEAHLAEERARHEVLPAEDEVFAALEATPFDRVKVVILGQDPYPTPDHAHGLAFSVRPGVKIPHSLANIHKEMESDLGLPRPHHGNLEHWARQGVLLLNTTLTVRAGVADSHRRWGWRHFTDEVVRALGERSEPTVFMLWGAAARKRKALIREQHLIIESSHPSPKSAHRSSPAYSSFLGSKPFSRANEFLESRGRGQVEWELPDLT